MAKAETYIKNINAQVKENHNGKVPGYLKLTIRRYAAALELEDFYMEQMMKEGAVIIEKGSSGQQTRKQHPLCNLIYQQECICQKYAKDLGLTAAKAAVKTESQGAQDATQSLDDYIDGIAPQGKR